VGAGALPAGALIVRAPDLPSELEPIRRLAPGEPDGELELFRARITGELAVRPRRIDLHECELHEVAFEPDERGLRSPGHRLRLTDVVLAGCDLSNVDACDGDFNRVAIRRSRLVGFSLSGGRARDLDVQGSSLQLASFADAGLRSVRFEGVDLREACFQRARLQGVQFIDCRLTGADFRQARLTGCAIRGASLVGIVGVEALRGIRMPWSDIVGSAGALAMALGIEIEE
jgi:uncharacterized protein YjbI with pentapeptide repeats